MAFLNWFFRDSPEREAMMPDREEMAAAASAARERLEAAGLLQIELDAQKEIQARVRAARKGRAGSRYAA